MRSRVEMRPKRRERASLCPRGSSRNENCLSVCLIGPRCQLLSARTYTFFVFSPGNKHSSRRHRSTHRTTHTLVQSTPAYTQATRAPTRAQRTQETEQQLARLACLLHLTRARARAPYAGRDCGARAIHERSNPSTLRCRSQPGASQVGEGSAGTRATCRAREQPARAGARTRVSEDLFRLFRTSNHRIGGPSVGQDRPFRASDAAVTL